MDNKKQTQKKLFISLFLIFVVFVFFFLYKNSKTKDNILEINGISIKIEVADDENERVRGLSGRKNLKEDEGMLFVFDSPQKYSFWMKEMNFPIDIIWLDEEKKIVSIKKDARKESYPELFYPTEDSLYVLEVNSLFSEKNNLKIGDQASFYLP